MTLGEKSYEYLSTLLSSAFVASSTEIPEVRAHQLDIICNTMRCLLEEFEREELEPGGGANPYIDPRIKWEEDHPEEMAKYAGQTIAIRIPEGIIAAGRDYAEVAAKLKKIPDRDVGNEVLIDCVPSDIWQLPSKS